MNPIRFLLLLVIAALICSCAKDHPTPEATPILPDLIIESTFENSEIESSSGREVFFYPNSFSQPCKSNTPSVLRPKIIKDKEIEIEYLNIDEYVNKINPKSIKWIVNGNEILQLTTTLKLPYSQGQYNIETIVTLIGGSEIRFPVFNLVIAGDMPLNDKGHIDFDPNITCVTGVTVGPSCLSQNVRASSIVIVDPTF